MEGAQRPAGGRRRMNNLLSAYYQLPEEKKPVAPVNSSEDPDKTGFDAKRYFDSMVSAGQLPDLMRRSETLDSEIKSLDTDMQALVYRNYSKFIHATDVIKEMKVRIDGLDGDMKELQGTCGRMREQQAQVDQSISGNAQALKAELRQQNLCKSLKVLLDLPSTLQTCLDRGAYRSAVQAYSSCAPFLRQHRNVGTLDQVLQETEAQMTLIRGALQERLGSAALSSEEAVACALTLLDIGEKDDFVIRQYLVGRSGVMTRSLKTCFDPDSPAPDPAYLPVLTEEPEIAAPEPELDPLSEDGLEGADASPKQVADKKDDGLSRPESILLQNVCGRLVESYVLELQYSVQGFKELLSGRTMEGSSDQALGEFVSRCITELCDGVAKLVEAKCPPTRALVACVIAVRDALLRLNTLLPRSSAKLFTGFLNSIANKALVTLFAEAAAQLVGELVKLEGICGSLQMARSSGLDSVLEEIGKTEEAIIIHGWKALEACQPLLDLLGQDRFARSQLVRDVHGQLITFFLVFVEACYAYIGKPPTEAHNLDPSLPVLKRVAVSEVDAFAKLQWGGLFALALVRIGRHLEVKAMASVWALAKDLFTRSEALGPAIDLQPNQAAIRAARSTAQALITHYVIVSGQHLSGLLRNAFEDKNWLTAREPRDPQLVVDFILKEVHVYDCQLARILGNPRKPPEVKHRSLSRQVKSAMELEMERLWAKKLQIFALVPFNRNGAVLGILRISFKALCENARERTFAKYGLQQVQVDCAFLADVMREFVEEEDAVGLDSLLDEAIASASKRCIEPVLMEDMIVQAICDEKKKHFRLD